MITSLTVSKRSTISGRISSAFDILTYKLVLISALDRSTVDHVWLDELSRGREALGGYLLDQVHNSAIVGDFIATNIKE